MSIDWDAELAKVHLPEDEEDKPKERTPEDTKRALHCCLVENEDVCECESCPYAVNGSSTWNCDVSVGKDTLAYIDQLEQRVPRWISVEERLPEDDDHYLVWAHDNGAEEVALYYGDGEWLTDDLENITRVVTHWMPLPEPPEEEKEDDHE